jgi:Rieske Fe-S protein
LSLSDLVRGHDHPWAALYEPSRQPAHSLGEYALENLESVSHYAQYVLPADVDDADDVGRGQGAIVREGLTLYAVSCNEQGVARKCSAVCPHLGGIVTWNGAERSWDCPVHGSRFDADGVVINSPANVNLKQIEQPSPEAVVVDDSLKLA